MGAVIREMHGDAGKQVLVAFIRQQIPVLQRLLAELGQVVIARTVHPHGNAAFILRGIAMQFGRHIGIGFRLGSFRGHVTIVAVAGGIIIILHRKVIHIGGIPRQPVRYFDQVPLLSTGVYRIVCG